MPVALIFWFTVFIFVSFMLGAKEFNTEFWAREFWAEGLWSREFWIKEFWVSFKNGIEQAWRISVVFGGLYGLWLATNRGKIADDVATTAATQADIASRSNQTERLKTALEMLWHPEQVGLQVVGCYALMSLGEEDVAMAAHCREQLINFVRNSVPIPKEKRAEPQQLDRAEIVAADRSLSSLYKKWNHCDEFRNFDLTGLPEWFWQIKVPGVTTRIYCGAILKSAKLNMADLRWAKLNGADLRQADLTEANLTDADLTKADFIRVKLDSAELTWAKLNGAKLRWAKLNRVDLHKGDLTGADLTGAQLNGATLTSTRLHKAKLTRAKLNGADLHEARFDGANLRQANFDGADLTKANLTGANITWAKLTKAKNLTQDQIDSAVYFPQYGPPELPSGLNYRKTTTKRSDSRPRTNDFKLWRKKSWVIKNVCL